MASRGNSPISSRTRAKRKAMVADQTTEVKTDVLPIPPPVAYVPGKPWKIWKKSLDIYMKAKKVTVDEDKVLILLQCVGENVIS